MKTIEISNQVFEKQKITFVNKIAIITGQNRAGKTMLLDQIASGLEGNSLDVLVDNRVVKKGEFQVVYLTDDRQFNEEIKLTKTSRFRNQLINRINKTLISNENYLDLNRQIETLAEKIKTITNLAITPNETAFTNKKIKLAFDTSQVNLEKIVDKLLEIDLIDQNTKSRLDEKHFNNFLLRMIVFNILLAGLDWEDKQRPIVILVDNPAVYANYQTLTEFAFELKKLLKFDHLYLCLATGNAELVSNLNCDLEAINLVKEREIIVFKDRYEMMEEAITILSFIKNNEYKNWQQFKINLQNVLEKADFEREFALFWNTEIINWFKMLFAKQIILADVTEIINLEDFETKNFAFVIRTNLLRQIMLVLYAKKLNIPVIFSEKLKTKLDKVNFLWN